MLVKEAPDHCRFLYITCHSIRYIISHANVYSNHLSRIYLNLKRNSHWIWVTKEKSSLNGLGPLIQNFPSSPAGAFPAKKIVKFMLERLAIMLPVSQNSGLRIVVYQHGYWYCYIYAFYTETLHIKTPCNKVTANMYNKTVIYQCMMTSEHVITLLAPQSHHPTEWLPQGDGPPQLVQRISVDWEMWIE